MCPDSNDKFISLVNTERSTSRHSVTRGVGMGSKALDDFLLDLEINCLTFSSHSISDESKQAVGAVRDESAGCGVAVASRSERMRSTFCTKN